MARPPMSDSITVLNPKLNAQGLPEKDQYGRFIYEENQSIARVQHTTKIIKNAQGQELLPKLEIDIPSTTKVSYGSKIKWIDRFNQLIEGEVIGIDETLNYSGKTVYFRTVYVG